MTKGRTAPRRTAKASQTLLRRNFIAGLAAVFGRPALAQTETHSLACEYDTALSTSSFARSSIHDGAFHLELETISPATLRTAKPETSNIDEGSWLKLLYTPGDVFLELSIVMPQSTAADDQKCEVFIELTTKDLEHVHFLYSDHPTSGTRNDKAIRSARWQLDQARQDLLKRSNTLIVVFRMQDGAFSMARYNIERTFKDLPILRRMYFRHKAAVEENGGDCHPGTAKVEVGSSDFRGIGGCVLTTASVDMLGRADDCFELRMMRRLRETYRQEQALIDDYVAVSNLALAQAPQIVLGPLLLMFWALFVLPTACCVRLGMTRAARRLYLAGFGLFKLALAPWLARGRA